MKKSIKIVHFAFMVFIASHFMSVRVWSSGLRSNTVPPVATLTSEQQWNLNGKLLEDAELGNYQGVQEAISKGADVNVIGGAGDSPLMFAVENGHEPIVELLLNQRNIDINQMGELRWTALMMAARRGYIRIIQLLLAHPSIEINKISEDGKDSTALMFAALNGRLGIVELLLQNGATPDNRDNLGKSALDLAQRRLNNPQRLPLSPQQKLVYERIAQLLLVYDALIPLKIDSMPKKSSYEEIHKYLLELKARNKNVFAMFSYTLDENELEEFAHMTDEEKLEILAGKIQAAEFKKYLIGKLYKTYALFQQRDSAPLKEFLLNEIGRDNFDLIQEFFKDQQHFDALLKQLGIA